MAKEDYYKILEVSKDATQEEIKSAYRKLAKLHHPDAIGAASEEEKRKAEARFKKINEAYEVLGDENKRAAYDRFGDAAADMGGGFSGFGGGFGGGGFGDAFSGGLNFEDILSSIFGGGFSSGVRAERRNAPMRGADIEFSMTLSFEEAAFGTDREIHLKREENCPDCKGTGAHKGTSFKTCGKCGGSGYVNNVKTTPFGKFSSTGPCPYCNGKGKVVTETCKSCSGKGRQEKAAAIRINIPAGIDNGQIMTMPNEGHAGYNGGDNGSLILKINVRPHKLFERRGADIYLDIPITLTQAALGAKISVPTLSQPQEFNIPAGTQSGTQFKLRGEGIKYLRRDGKGDLYFNVIVEVPKNLDRRQRELLSELEASFGKAQHPQIKNYQDKL